MSRRRALPALGTMFLVPLRDRGFALGVLARADGKGCAFGYFFGPRLSGPEEIRVDIVLPEYALLVGMFGDLELLRGKWPIVGEVEPWSLELWPLPPLCRVDEKVGRAWLSTYGDTLECLTEQEIDCAKARDYHYDRLMGAGAVEIRLTNLIKAAQSAKK